MKKTFLNLSEKKRNIIINSVKEEFLLHPFYNASVASIIDRAGISRGSFYQYFENLEEAYFDILELFTIDTHHLFIELLKESKFEYTHALDKYGKILSKEMLKDDAYNLYKYRYLNWTIELEEKYEKYLINNKNEYTKYSNLLKNNEEMMFIKAVVHDLFCRLFKENLTKDEFLEKYNLHCKWIITGLKNGGNI